MSFPAIALLASLNLFVVAVTRRAARHADSPDPHATRRIVLGRCDAALAGTGALTIATMAAAVLVEVTIATSVTIFVVFVFHVGVLYLCRRHLVAAFDAAIAAHDEEA